MDIERLKEVAQLGGLAIFAVSVWWELHQQRKERAADAEQARKERKEDAAVTNAVLGSMRDAVAGLLERERMRSETPPYGVRRPTNADG